MRGHRITQQKIDALYDAADSLWDLGAQDAARFVGAAAYDLHCADCELGCVVDLLKHPKRHKRELAEWTADIVRLGWGQRRRCPINDWKPPSATLSAEAEETPSERLN